MSREQKRQTPPWRIPALMVVVAAVAFSVGYYTGDRAARPDPTSMEGIVAALSAQQREDHRSMTEELAEAAHRAHTDLMVVLAGMNQAMPAEPGVAPVPASPEEVEAWGRATEAVLEELTGFGTGTTDFNGAVAALRASVRQIDAAAALYGEALAAESPRLAELAAGLRNDAVDLWATGAEQLDSLAIDAGLGHVHLFLPITGDPEAVPLEFQEPQDR